MSTEPDPGIVREIAQEIILKQAKYWNAMEIRQDYRSDPRCARLDAENFTDLRDAVINAIVDATVTVSWPDEQPAAGQVGDMRAAAGRLAAFVGCWDQLIGTKLLTGAVEDTWLPAVALADLRAVLAENARMRQERAEFVDLLGWHVDAEDDPCRLDHHGYCQAHGSFTEGPCRTAAGRELLARVRADTAPQQPARDAANGDAECECGCRPGQTCICSVHDCDCIGGCPVCDADETEHAPGGEAL